MKMTEPIKDKKDVRRLLKFYLRKENLNYRNYLLIALGLFTALRISDILRMKWSDVLDEKGEIKDRIAVKEKKTGKLNIIKVNKELEKVIKIAIEHMEDKTGLIFKGARDKTKPLNRSQAYRIVKKAVDKLKLGKRISCHSLRKTVGYHMYLKGLSPVLLMNIYNHSAFEITKRYLCIDQFEKDEAFSNLSYF